MQRFFHRVQLQPVRGCASVIIDTSGAGWLGLTMPRKLRIEYPGAMQPKAWLAAGPSGWLRLLDGVILKGRLLLKEELLFPEMQELGNVELAIGRVTFKHSEIESCIRL